MSTEISATTTVRRTRQRVSELLSVAEQGDRASRIVDLALAAFIMLNVAASICQTLDSLYANWRRWFDGLESVSVIIFTIEYILRVWSCTARREFSRPVRGRLRFMLTPLALIDLLAILPFYLPTQGLVDLRMLRAIRLARLLRILKVARYSESLQLLGRVLVLRRAELVITFSAGGFLLLIASSLMYFVENEAQPEMFASIPAAMWWGVETLTTVGYGDAIPITPLGKVLGAVIAFLGIGLFALPAGILGSGFVEEIQKRRRRGVRCPHCDQMIDP